MSMSRAPGGGGLRPGAIAWIRPSTMVMVEGPAAGFIGSVISRPAWTTRGSAAAGAAASRARSKRRRFSIASGPQGRRRLHAARRGGLTREKPAALSRHGLPRGHVPLRDARKGTCPHFATGGDTYLSDERYVSPATSVEEVVDHVDHL